MFFVDNVCTKWYDFVPAEIGGIFIYNIYVLNDFNHLTTGEKINGSTFTLYM